MSEKNPSIASDEAAPVVSQEASVTFQDLPLHDDVLAAISTSGYTVPTPVQAQIIPHMLAGRDVLAQSQTGTGKTAAFALPILSRIDVQNRQPQVLVLAPTRELAIQVAKSFATYGAQLSDFQVATIYGGQDYEPQLRQLRRGAQVVVGTPGRVIDHIKRGSLNIGNIQCLVLDEADEMLNMGFLEDVQFVLKQAPAERQIALFSATLPTAIQKIAKEYLNDPVHIKIKKKTMTADSIRQRALIVSPRDKIHVLGRILEAENTDGVIVFTKTKVATMSVAEKLARDGFSAIALNGDMPQTVRERTIEQFKSGRLDVLVATDVAARGLDVSRVSHVINFDLPHDTESYIHRVGRTGRAGRSGEAIIFLTKSQRGKLRQIERMTKQSIEMMSPPSTNQINENRVNRFKQQMTDVAAKQDLTMFKELLTSYAEESGKPMEMIAATLAHISLQGRPFVAKDQPRRDSRDFDEDRQRDRHDRSDSRGPRRARTVGPPQEGKRRYRIEVGRRDGVKPGNIVGAIANEAGIDGEFIGPIQIQDSFSTVDLPAGMPQDIFQSLQNTRIVGKPCRISIDQGSGGGGSGARYHKPSGGSHRSHGGKSSGGKSHGGKSHGGKPHSGKSHGGKPGAKRSKQAGGKGNPVHAKKRGKNVK